VQSLQLLYFEKHITFWLCADSFRSIFQDWTSGENPERIDNFNKLIN